MIEIDPKWGVQQEGWEDARDGEPLFEDADPEYAGGWCAFWRIENPYTPIRPSKELP